MRLLLCISFLSLIFAQPDWSDNPGAYQLTASMTADVLIDGVSITAEGDILGAFDANDNVRGISTMMDGLENYADVTLHAITIRSNSNGDIISFKYYDASGDAIYDLQESYTFVSNDLIGNLMTPYTLSYDNMVIKDGLLSLYYTLEQNYPNPYNPKTYINYTISDLSNVMLRIYDIKGQLISELLHKVHSPGKYETIWNSGLLATGIYFLEMQVFSINGQFIFRDINKMLYLK